MKALREGTAERGVKLHIDGARLWNACAATGAEPSAFAAHADSVTCCLSKGLGAPVGSVLAGSKDFVAEARKVRKCLGGGMRQAGVLAAAGLLALEDGLARLAEDHALARALAAQVGRIDGLAPPERVDTNIVNVRVLRPDLDAPAVAARLAERGVLVLALEPRVLRFITHRDVGPADVERVGAALADVLAGPAPWPAGPAPT